MAKASIIIGYSTQVESAPGVWVDHIREQTYQCDILLDQHRWQSADKVNDNLNIDNKISILADPYMCKNLDSIRYVTIYGTKWKVQTITINRPRIDIYLGGVYNGPT